MKASAVDGSDSVTTLPLVFNSSTVNVSDGESLEAAAGVDVLLLFDLDLTCGVAHLKTPLVTWWQLERIPSSIGKKQRNKKKGEETEVPSPYR